MDILVVGSGGREHTIAWSVSQSPQVSQVWVAPGNAGTALEPSVINVPIQATDIDALVTWAQERSIDLTIIGPEAPLASDIVTRFQNAGLPCFGPTQQAAQLESSKTFCKEFLNRHQIPTAAAESFSDYDSAKQALMGRHYPVVIKADGLAAGKGVFIAQSEAEAHAALDALFHNKIVGDAAHTVLIEEFLEGEELSFIVIADGLHYVSLASSQDYKRRNDNNEGPNTGGMGSISPAPLCTPELEKRICQEIIEPTLQHMTEEGHPYTGFLYAGLMIDADGQPHLLEYNCRLGDPETQSILMRLQSDLTELCQAALHHQLPSITPQWSRDVAVTVVMASGEYPLSYNTGDLIQGLPDDTASLKIFHAGTQQTEQGITTNGGRVLGVTALGPTASHARDTAYAAVHTIHWPGSFYRTDIGQDITVTINSSS